MFLKAASTAADRHTVPVSLHSTCGALPHMTQVTA
jgi:hypothetical protein